MVDPSIQRILIKRGTIKLAHEPFWKDCDLSPHFSVMIFLTEICHVVKTVTHFQLPWIDQTARWNLKGKHFIRGMNVWSGSVGQGEIKEELEK